MEKFWDFVCFLQSANNEDLVIVKTRFVAVLHFDEKVVIWLFFSHDIAWLSCRRVFPGKTCEKALNLIGGGVQSS